MATWQLGSLITDWLVIFIGVVKSVARRMRRGWKEYNNVLVAEVRTVGKQFKQLANITL
jgi:TM2 domain-containing membrane protein YozV